MAAVLEYDGSTCFELRILLCLISGKKIKINGIRVDEGGISDVEMNLLELLEKITLGSIAEIDETGTSLTYSPGTIQGCDVLYHECHPGAPMGYYIWPLLVLGPLSQIGIMDLTLVGASICSYGAELNNDHSATEYIYPSVEFIRQVVIPNLKFVDPSLSEAGIKLKGNGFLGSSASAVLRIPAISKVNSLRHLEMGRIKRIRGTAVLLGINKSIGTRMKTVVKKTLSPICPDVFIYESLCKPEPINKDDPIKRGSGLIIVGESDKGVLVGGEYFVDRALVDEIESDKFFSEKEVRDTDAVAYLACSRFLAELYRGGVVGSYLQSIFLIFMALGDETNLGMIRLGELAPSIDLCMRHIQDFLSIKFHADNDSNVLDVEEKEDVSTEDESSDSNDDNNLTTVKTVILKCVGRGFVNINKTY